MKKNLSREKAMDIFDKAKKLTKAQKQECIKTLLACGVYHGELFAYYHNDLTQDQKEECYKNALIYKEGCYLFVYAYDKLTEQQKQECIDNAIGSNESYFLYINHGGKLTKEQASKLYEISCTATH